MKMLSRDFTLKEKLLLLVLALLLLGLFYYYMVDQPMRRDLTDAQSRSQSLELELMAVNAKLTRLEEMTQELEETKSAPRMLSYNGAKEEVKLLNDILQKADTYTMNFYDVDRQGNQIRREVTLAYSAADYAVAMNILKQLSESPYRCLIGDVSCSTPGKQAIDLRADTVNVSLSMTFYETMVDGVPDAGLPAEQIEQGDKIDRYLDEYY